MLRKLIIVREETELPSAVARIRGKTRSITSCCRININFYVVYVAIMLG
jgi:hypothetical protein